MIAAGDKIGKFVVTRHLGAGGMGTVYEARDPELSRDVAIKLVLDAAADPIRLLREAQALARISHPNVVAVYELGSHDDNVFVAMELIDGVTIDRYIAAQKCNWRAILGLYMQAGRGLAAVHAEGLVHRDIKPSNILVDKDGRVCVGDFGLARRDDPTDPSDAITRDGKAPSTSSVTVDGPTATSIDSKPGPAPDGAALDAQITERGAVVGTPRYMAPEQHDGHRATRASDQYSLAVAMWEAIYGELPGDLHREAPNGAKAPAWVESILVRALERDPGSRWPSVAAFLAQLERAPKRRARLAIGVGGTALVAGTVAALFGFGAFGGKQVDCGRAGDPVAAAWTAEARSRTTAAIRAVGPAWAQAADSASAAIDRWAERARDVRIDACRATHDRGSQTEALLDKRVACLDGQQAVLDALVRAFARADRGVAEHALDAVERLPAPETCTAARFVDGATPMSAGMAAALAEATVAVDLQRADARGATERLIATSQGLDPTVRSRAHLLNGRALAASDPKASRVELDAALSDAAASRDPGLEAEVVIGMLLIAAGDDSADRIDALLPVARAAVTRAGGPRPLAYSLAKVEFEAHARLGRVDPARAACKRVVDLADPIRTSIDAASCRCKLELVMRERSSATSCEEALRLVTKELGAGHPRTVDNAHNWILALVYVGSFPQAETAARANVAVVTSLYGRDSLHVVASLQLLSTTEDRVGKVAESRATLEEALAILDRVSPDSPKRAALLLELADRALQQKDKAAIRYADSGLAAAERQLGPDHRDLGAVLVNHAKALALDPAQLPRARESWRRAIALGEKNAGPQSFTLASILSSYAFFLANEESIPISEALEPAKRAAPIFEALGETLSLARTEGMIGEVYLVEKNKPEARAWLTKSRDHFAAVGDPVKDELANIQRVLASAQ